MPKSSSTQSGHAVIATGGKQYLVAVGDVVQIEKLDQEPKASVDFRDELSGGTVKATVVSHGRTKKVTGRLFHNKVRARRYPRGHRQHITSIQIDAIA